MKGNIQTKNMNITFETNYELPYGNQPKMEVSGRVTYTDSVDKFTRDFSGILSLEVYDFYEASIRMTPSLEWVGKESNFEEYYLAIESVEEAYNDKYNS